MNLTPSKVVAELDKHIVGQSASKKAVAIALRNRWRRLQLPKEQADDIYPKNILMIGPTGVGKTEIARRLAKLIDAPFIKVEATKFTEVGYVGRDVESIIRQLADIAMHKVREIAQSQNQENIHNAVEELLLDLLLPSNKDNNDDQDNAEARQLLRKKLREGELEDREIAITAKPNFQLGMQLQNPKNLEDIMGDIQKIMQPLNREKVQRIPIKEARKIMTSDATEDILSRVDLRARAVELTESSGIVFIDEIDKIVKTSDGLHGGQVSREGVQRDLLPIIEGSQVKTKIGYVNTDHIFFIASGAFHNSKPADLIPELQGRLPVRVELENLSAKDFERILREPKSSLIKQYKQLLAVDSVLLNFTDGAIKKIAELAHLANMQIENIGARRLHTLMERLLEEVSFHIPEQNIEVTITEQMVSNNLESFIKQPDLNKFIL